MAVRRIQNQNDKKYMDCIPYCFSFRKNPGSLMVHMEISLREKLESMGEGEWLRLSTHENFSCEDAERLIYSINDVEVIMLTIANAY